MPSSKVKPVHDLFLAARPSYFRVSYSINGWMNLEAWRERPQAILAGVKLFWRVVGLEITNNGDELIRAPGHRLFPDWVFAADPCVAWIDENGQRRALMSNMKHPERKGEVDVWRQNILPRNGFETTDSILHREGSGDSLFDPNYGIWWTGVGERTAVGAGEQQSQLTGRTVIELQTKDHHFYHLDTFLSFLPSGHVVVYKDALTEKDYKTLCSFYPHDKRFELTKGEAETFAANLQFVTKYGPKGRSLSHKVFVPKDTPPRLARTLRDWGYRVKPVDVSGVRLAGGGTHCCFQRVWDLRRFAEKALPDALLERLKTDDRLKSSIWLSQPHKRALTTASAKPLAEPAQLGM